MNGAYTRPEVGGISIPIMFSTDLGEAPGNICTYITNGLTCVLRGRLLVLILTFWKQFA
jgi:hypothetical protein